VDEYFARALAFSGCSLLTLTMIGKKNLLTDDGVESELAGETLRLLEERIALKGITVTGDTKTPEVAGVMPAIQKLLSRSKGAGFVNADPDSDGLHRRIELLVKYRENYYGHLALMALLESLENPQI
jgi:adenylate cyclase